MTVQEKLNKIEEIVQEYIQDNTLLIPSAGETAGQKNIREDMQAIVSVISREDVKSDMTSQTSSQITGDLGKSQT
jgi:hypothetical protein